MIQTFAPATVQKNINLEIITEMILPLAELATIVARVGALMEHCRTLAAEIAHTRILPPTSSKPSSKKLSPAPQPTAES